MNPLKLLITIIYAGLLLWGASVGFRQIYQGFKMPQELLNPLFGNRQAIKMFTVHIAVVTADLAIIGPLAVAHKSTLWYWGGRIALLSSSLPLATFLNRNPESFGKLIGRWVLFRNFFEYTVHVVVAALALNWFRYYVLLWWLVAYRYLDVGPRRSLQKLYDTPEKKAARPWAPLLNWAVIASLYVLSFLAVYNRQILFAHVPGANVRPHVPAHWETGLVWGGDLALVLVMWTMTKKYVQSLLAAAGAQPAPVPRGGPLAS